MAGAQKIHLEARSALPRELGFARYMNVSVCGRYVRKSADDEHLRRRLTSAVTCTKCRFRWLKRGTATPPTGKAA